MDALHSAARALPPRFAIIPTRNRPDLYARCVEAISPQIDHLITIGHLGPEYASGLVIDYDEPIPNISRMWNLGLDAAARIALEEGADEWFVAILNDDAAVPPGWLNAITSAMLAEHTFLGSVPHEQTDAMIQGWAFVLKGARNSPGYTIRPDEQWSWWASDNHLVQQADLYWGGWSRVRGLDVAHDQKPLPPGRHRRRAEADRDRWIAQQKAGRG